MKKEKIILEMDVEKSLKDLMNRYTYASFPAKIEEDYAQLLSYSKTLCECVGKNDDVVLSKLEQFSKDFPVLEMPTSEEEQQRAWAKRDSILETFVKVYSIKPAFEQIRIEYKILEHIILNYIQDITEALDLSMHSNTKFKIAVPEKVKEMVKKFFALVASNYQKLETLVKEKSSDPKLTHSIIDTRNSIYAYDHYAKAIDQYVISI